MSRTETVFRADRATYIRTQAWLAALAMAGAMAVLWLLGNPYVWTGAVAGLAAIGLRGWYLASEELTNEWVLAGRELRLPNGSTVPLSEIETLNTMMSYVQVVTKGGDKHLIKHQSNPAATCAALETAIARGHA